MPGGIRLFLVYALTIMSVIGLSLRYVIDLAIAAPVSLPGVVVMALLAYTIFTITVILQRKQIARGLALGLSSLTLPLLAFAALSGLEGILPALESAHAIAWVMKTRRASHELILINLSGRGDKDVAMVAELTGAAL